MSCNQCPNQPVNPSVGSLWTDTLGNRKVITAVHPVGEVHWQGSKGDSGVMLESMWRAYHQPTGQSLPQIGHTFRRNCDGTVVVVTGYKLGYGLSRKPAVCYSVDRQQPTCQTQGVCPLGAWATQYTPCTITGRKPSEPDLQKLSPWRRPATGSVWSNRGDGCAATVRGVVKRNGADWVRYTKANGVLGSCRLAVWDEVYTPAPGAVVTLDFAKLECELAFPGIDLHKMRAADIFNVPPSSVTDAMRKVGKTANFIDMYRGK